MNLQKYFANAAAMPPALAYLETIFPATIAIPVLEAGRFIGLSEAGTRHRLWRGDFPIPTYLEGRRRMCFKTDLAAYIERRSELPKRRGPKTKAERIAARKAAEGSQNG